MAESYTGQVRDGVVVFEGDLSLPEGTRVRVEPIATTVETPADADRMAATRAWLLGWAGRAEANAPSLPSDLAERHDHYAHGRLRS